MSAASVPYASATSGEKAMAELRKLLQTFGCDKVGVADDFAKKEVIVVWTYRGRRMQVKGSAQGWANMYLRRNPWNRARHLDEQTYKARWLAQGQIAIYSCLRDFVKAQLSIVEMGLFEFDQVFMPYMLLPNGRTVADTVLAGEALPALEDMREDHD